MANRSSDRMDLAEQLNYQNKLVAQLPSPQLRVVYNKSGMHVVAAKVTDRRALIENGLYWTTPASESEANYLCAILNSPYLTDLVRPLMSYGKDERDVAKNVWELPIPEFDESDDLHLLLAKSGGILESEVANIDTTSTSHNPTLRREYRTLLDESVTMLQVNELVLDLLS